MIKVEIRRTNGCPEHVEVITARSAKDARVIVMAINNGSIDAVARILDNS